MDVPGKFAVIMADPPSTIDMQLPHGTLPDSEMRHTRLECLLDEGFILSGSLAGTHFLVSGKLFTFQRTLFI